METVFGLHNLRYLFRIGKIERHVGKRRIEISTTYVVHLAALPCRARILRIEARQRCESGLAAHHTLCVCAQIILHTVDFFLLNLRLLGYDFHLNLSRNERQTVFRQVVEIATHVGRSDCNVSHKLLFHKIYELTVLELVVQFLTHLRYGRLAVFLKFLTRTGHLNPTVYLFVDGSCHF